MGLFGSHVEGIRNILTDSNLKKGVPSDTMCECLELKENRAVSRWSIGISLHLTHLTSKIFPNPSKPYFVANHDCAIHLTSLPSAALHFVLTLNACIITRVFLSGNKLLTSNAHLSCLKNETLRFSFLLWRTQNFFSTNSVFVFGDFLPNEKQHETFKKKTIFLFRSLPFFGVYHL